MADRLSWLNRLKGGQLKFLATRVGTNSSGTKAQITRDIRAKIVSDYREWKHTSARDDLQAKAQQINTIISVDMGVKNLAYCQLVPASAFPEGKATLTHWQRLNIFEQEDDGDRPSLDFKNASQPKITYNPGPFALAAHRIASTLVQLDPASSIHIERQRFRSMGASSVLEWTIKVNVLEGMLYASLATLKETSQWTGSAHGPRPERVSAFWLNRYSCGDIEGGKQSKDMKMQKKKGLMGVVQRWLQKEELHTAGQGEWTAARYVANFGLRKRQQGFEKLDDLADCLAQGMAVLQWRENSRLCWERGEEALANLQ